MTEQNCPSCNRSDVGEGRFCRECGQMLIAPAGIRLASLGQRLAGFVLDGFVLSAAAVSGLVFLIDVLGIFNLPNLLVGALLLVSGGLFGVWAVWWLAVITRSQTPGKQITGTRVVDAATGEPAGLVRTLFRESVAKMGTATVLGWFFGIHVLWILWDVDRQGLYDKIAGTVVVDDREYRLEALL